MSESGFGKLGTVDGAVGIENARSEDSHNFVVNRLARLHQLVSDVVGLNQVRAAGHEHFAHDRLAARDAAGEADFQQRALVSAGTSKPKPTTEAQRHREKLWGKALADATKADSVLRCAHRRNEK
jgi:hypothetical protein